MSFVTRFRYYQRILRAYLVPGISQLSFWHETPKANPKAEFDKLGEYYMGFEAKADYSGYHDASGIPMLDYHGQIGLQHNPIAIAQWGLGNYNLYLRTGSEDHLRKSLKASDWLCSKLAPNSFGIWVWNHNFDWEYRETLKAPWYSGLAQGQGISLLVRTHRETNNARYLQSAEKAFASFQRGVDEGGVTFSDDRGDLWFEEYLVSPPTHILNGFIWAAWGIKDYFIATGNPTANELFHRAVQTLLRNLDCYDVNFWSLYEQSGTRLKMLASPFYHELHIVQLRVMYLLTGQKKFVQFADRWEAYARSPLKRIRALCYKSAFKLFYY